MKNQKLLRTLETGTPLYCLLVLLILFYFPVKWYVQCQSDPCQAIDKNLTSILILDDTKNREVRWTDTAETKQKAMHQQTASIYSGRLMFLFFDVAYVATCGLAFVVGCFVIAKSLRRAGKQPMTWLLILVSVCGVVAVYLYHHPEKHMRLFAPLLKNTISHDLAAAEPLLILSNSFGFSVALFLTLACCAVLYSPTTTSYPEALKQIAEQMKHLRLILYVGTFMLVAGVFQIRSVYQWSLAFLLRDEQSIKVTEKFFADLLSIEGAYFTLILAVVYLPAAFLLQRRADSLTELPQLETEKEKVLKDYGLGFSLSQSLPRVLAILGPLLAGPVGELFSRVG